jgi:hypothetical protein
MYSCHIKNSDMCETIWRNSPGGGKGLSFMKCIIQRPLFVCVQWGSNFHTRAVNGAHNLCGWRKLLYHRKVKRKFRPVMTISSFRDWKITNLNVDRYLLDVSTSDNRYYQHKYCYVGRSRCVSNWVTSNIMYRGITLPNNWQHLFSVVLKYPTYTKSRSNIAHRSDFQEYKSHVQLLWTRVRLSCLLYILQQDHAK